MRVWGYPGIIYTCVGVLYEGVAVTHINYPILYSQISHALTNHTAICVGERFYLLGNDFFSIHYMRVRV